MIARNCASVLPEAGVLDAEDRRILDQADALLEECRAAIAGQEFHLALNAIWNVVGEANRYFATAAPWALKKTDPTRMGTVLYVTAEVLREIAILVQPVMPESAGKLLDLLAVPPDGRSFAALGAGGRLVPGTVLPEPKPVFPRYIDEPAAT
jgi:methionyl-tRNA synthetase